MTDKKAIILGAGLTGLTTAFYLKKAGWQVQILERDRRAGGTILTHREDGFVFESGPNTGLISHPDVKDLLLQLCNDVEIEFLGESAQRRLVWHNCRWHPLPYGLSDSLRTPLFKWNEKLKLLLGSIRNNQYVLDQLSQKTNLRPNYTVDPYIQAIYSGDFHGLLTKKQDGAYLKSEFDNSRENIKNNHSNKDKQNSKNEHQLFFINGGLDNLVKALVKNIGEANFMFGVENITIYPKENRYAVAFKYKEAVHNDNVPVVISTVGAIELGKIFPFLNNKEKDLISNFSHIHVVQVVAGFNKWRGIPLKAFGGLVPHNEKRDILGVLFPSSFLKERAPKNGALLSVFLGGIHKPQTVDLPNETIEKMVMDELRCMLLIPDEQPDLFRIFRHHYAFPQYNDIPDMRLKTISDIERQFPGLILGGIMRDGVGMAHRIWQGTKIARELTRHFT